MLTMTITSYVDLQKKIVKIHKVWGAVTLCPVGGVIILCL